ncbi:MAG: hypothetical protein AAGK69_01515, partial [Pseudomonadota bacterium]
MSTFGARFGALISRKREERGWSFAQLAVAAYGDDRKGGESRKADVQKLETGGSAKPNAATIRKYRVALDLTQDEIDACFSSEKKMARSTAAHAKPLSTVSDIETSQRAIALALPGETDERSPQASFTVEAIQSSRDAEYAYLFAQVSASPHSPGEIARLLA